MPRNDYTLAADEPFYKQVPWWVWVLGLGVLFVMLKGKKQQGYEDYLR